MDSDYDSSELGKKRAIPAKFVYAVIEVKAAFNFQSVADVISKLSELNQLANHLPKSFSCCSIFLELTEKEISKTETLKLLLPITPFQFWGGMIMSCSVNIEMTGLISYGSSDVPIDDNLQHMPLAKDVDQLDIKPSEDGSLTINEEGAGVMLIKTNEKAWSVSKYYFKSSYHGNFSVTLAWSHNQFARFQIILLTLLEGRNPFSSETNGIIFGQVFDHY
jgi:hypothetical protein